MPDIKNDTENSTEKPDANLELRKKRDALEIEFNRVKARRENLLAEAENCTKRMYQISGQHELILEMLKEGQPPLQ